MALNFEAKEAYAVFCLNRARMLELFLGYVDMEQAAKDISARRWEAKLIHWVYDRAGLVPVRNPKRNVHEEEGIQEDGTYRLTESQAMVILTMPMRSLLSVNHDRILHDWNESFFIEKRCKKEPA